MTDEEFQKILADPEIQRLIKANGLKVPIFDDDDPFNEPPTAKLQIEPQIDPQLARQLKQYLALQGGGTFGEQVGANLNAGCAQLAAILGIILLVGLGLLVLVAFLYAVGSSHH
jgi:hypothetical protein